MTELMNTCQNVNLCSCVFKHLEIRGHCHNLGGVGLKILFFV